MKNKLLATLAIFGMVASASAVKINNNLSINGFIDGSYKLVDSDTAADNDQGLDADEAEINFVFSNGAVSGLIAIDSHEIGGGLNGANKADLDIEQAHFTYDLGNGVSFTFGRYGSALGFEREDPAGLYTFSRAYASANIGDVDSGAVEGVTVSYAADQFSIAASFENPRGANLESNDLDLELSLSYTGIADTVIGGGFFFDNESAGTEEVNVLNVHASRSFGKLLLGAEYIQLQSDDANTGDRDAYMVLADYDYTDKIGVAVRLSKEEVDTNNDYEKITIAPNYSFTDNLGAILEFSDVESNNVDSNEIAVELTYTF
jgi:hypothetical protein